VWAILSIASSVGDLDEAAWNATSVVDPSTSDGCNGLLC